MGGPVERGERTLVVWCPDWPVVAAGASLTEPVAVVHANRVVACSPIARTEGAVQGLRRRESQSRCPELVVLDHDPGRDARAFEPVAAALGALTPRVAVDQAGSVAFATRGPSRYFGGDDALAGRGAALVRPSWRTGVGAGGRGPTVPSRRRAPPPGRPGQPAVGGPRGQPAFIAPRPIEALTLVGDELLDEAGGAPHGRRPWVDVLGPARFFARWRPGRRRPTDVLARFGPVGALAHRLARGLDARPLHARRPAPELAVEAELDPPVEQVAGAVFVAKVLADRLHESLGNQGLACIQVMVTAETEHAEVHQRRWRHEGSLTASAVADRVRWQLDGWLSGSVATRPTAGITRITLTPDEVVAAQGRQLGFWGGETKVDERVVRALARVSGMSATKRSRARVPGRPQPAERVARSRSPPRSPRRTPAARPGWVTEPWPGHLPAPSPALVMPELQTAEVLDRAATGACHRRGTITAAPAMVVRCPAPGSRPRPKRPPTEGHPSCPGGTVPPRSGWLYSTCHRRRAPSSHGPPTATPHLLVLENGRWWLEGTYD